MKNRKLYSLEAVERYIENNDLMVDEIIDGVLLDTLIIYHGGDVVEVFEETYLNCWSSAYTRHVYKKGLPKRFKGVTAWL